MMIIAHRDDNRCIGVSQHLQTMIRFRWWTFVKVGNISKEGSHPKADGPRIRTQGQGYTHAVAGTQQKRGPTRGKGRKASDEWAVTNCTCACSVSNDAACIYHVRHHAVRRYLFIATAPHTRRKAFVRDVRGLGEVRPFSVNRPLLREVQMPYTCEMQKTLDDLASHVVRVPSFSFLIPLEHVGCLVPAGSSAVGVGVKIEEQVLPKRVVTWHNYLVECIATPNTTKPHHVNMCKFLRTERGRASQQRHLPSTFQPTPPTNSPRKSPYSTKTGLQPEGKGSKGAGST